MASSAGATATEGYKADEEVSLGKLDHWHVIAHVHGKEIKISIGDASQRVKWLAFVAIARWDEENCQGWKRLGVPTTVKAKYRDGEELDMESVLREVITNGEHIYVSSSLNPMDTR